MTLTRRSYAITLQLSQSRPRSVQSHAWTGAVSSRMRVGGTADSSHQAPHLPDQRLRLLPGYALEGFAHNWRERAAVVFARRLARMSVLYGSRTRRTGM